MPERRSHSHSCFPNCRIFADQFSTCRSEREEVGRGGGGGGGGGERGEEEEMKEKERQRVLPRRLLRPHLAPCLTPGRGKGALQPEGVPFHVHQSITLGQSPLQCQAIEIQSRKRDRSPSGLSGDSCRHVPRCGRRHGNRKSRDRVISRTGFIKGDQGRS